VAAVILVLVYAKSVASRLQSTRGPALAALSCGSADALAAGIAQLQAIRLVHSSKLFFTLFVSVHKASFSARRSFKLQALEIHLASILKCIN